MEVLFIEEYGEFLDSLKEKIMSIQVKYYDKCKLLDYDYSNGKISKRDYDRYKWRKINNYGVDKYSLSREEIDFLNKYASISEAGVLTAKIVKDEYIEKYAMLSNVIKAVKIFGYFDNLSYEDKKMVLRQILENDESVSEEFILRLDSCDDDDGLIELICQYYDIDYNDYIWYKQMDAKHKSAGNQRMMKNLVQRTCTENCQKFSIMDESYRNFLAVFEEFLSFTQLVNSCYDGKKDGFKLFKKNNKEELFDIFLEVYNKTSYFEKSSNLEPKDVFENYFSSIYGRDVTYVRKSFFCHCLYEDVMAYYRKKIRGYDSINIQNILLDLKNRTEFMNSRVEELCLTDDLSHDIHLSWLDLDEEERLYTDISAYVNINGNNLGLRKEKRNVL